LRRRSERSRFLLGAFAGYVQIGALLFGSVIAIGVIVRCVGAEVSAAWALLYTVMSAVELTALGLSLPLVNGMARCDDDSARWAILKGTLKKAAVAAIVLAVATILLRVPIGQALAFLFGSVAKTVPTLSDALPWCVALALLKSAGYLATFSFTGMHEVHITRAFQALYAIAPAFGVIPLLLGSENFWSLFIGVQAWHLATLLGLAAYLRARRPSILSDSTPPRLADLTSQAIRYGIVLVSNQAVLASGGFIAAAFASPRDVLAYVLLWRLAAVMTTLVNVVPSTLWPKMAALDTSRQSGDSNLIGRLIVATMVIAAAGGMGLAWNAEWLIELWAGPSLYAGPFVAAMLGIYVIGQGTGLTALNLAVARDLNLKIVIAIAGYAILVIAGSVSLGQTFGLRGIAIGAGLITLFAYCGFAFRIPPQLGFPIAKDDLRTMLLQLATGLGGIVGMFISQQFGPTFVIRMIFGAIIFASWSILAWLGLPRRDRNSLREIFRMPVH